MAVVLYVFKSPRVQVQMNLVAGLVKKQDQRLQEPWFGLLVGTIRMYLCTKFDALIINCLGDINHSSQILVKIGTFMLGYEFLHEYHS